MTEGGEIQRHGVFVCLSFFVAINRVDLSMRRMRDEIKAEVTGNTFTAVLLTFLRRSETLSLG